MAGEKRSADDASEKLHQESAILLDVEGTTSSISFVQDTLFPYIREFLKKHVDEKWSTEEFKADFAKLKEQAKEDEEKKVDGFVPIKEDTEDEAKETLIKNVLWQMDNDRKTGALKQLQGHMWKAAHKPIKGHVYDDVPKTFEEWTNMGKKLYIYSSGSIEAQKLLYGDSVHGDLLKYISGHFDTTIGPKQEADSYKNILKEINLEPSNVLFLTDIVKEAQTAKEAGLAVAIVIREGNAKVSDEDKATFKTIESFTELHFESTSKRQKLNEDEQSKKKHAPKEDTVVTEPANNEPMDTSEDLKVSNDEKKTDTTTDVKVVESNVEKVVEAEKNVETKESEMEITPMEEDTKSEKKTEDDTKTKNTENSNEDKSKIISSEEKVTVDGSGAEKNSIEVEKKKTLEIEEKKTIEAEEKKTMDVEKKKTIEVEEEKTIEVEEKKTMDAEEKKTIEVEEKKTIKVEEKTSGDVIKESEKVSLSEEKTLPTEVPEKTENKTETITEKLAEEVTEKIVNETAKDIEKETKSEEKEVKENGESKLTEPEQNNKSVDSKVEETENKENVQSENIEEKNESKAEATEETKETIAVENSGGSEKNEKETEKVSNVESEPATEKSEVKALNGTSSNGDVVKNVSDEKVHTNGINNKTEKIKENDESEESIKVKKAVADGAGDTDVVVPSVVAATS